MQFFPVSVSWLSENKDDVIRFLLNRANFFVILFLL